MPLTAAEHQKIAALQQIANLVGQAQSVAGNPNVLRNVVNNTLPLITQWERNDPEFQELALWLRRARTDSSPHVLSNIVGQVQRMLSLVRGGLGYKTNRQGERVIWDPIRGNVTSPLFEQGEPVRMYSHMGWRGSKKYPFGKAFPEKNLIEGWTDDARSGMWQYFKPMIPWILLTGVLTAFATWKAASVVCSGRLLLDDVTDKARDAWRAGKRKLSRKP